MTEQVKVEQSDRDAAAPWVIVPANERKIRAGEMDWNPIVQAFARHRLASQAQIVADMAARIEGMKMTDIATRAGGSEFNDGLDAALAALTPPENEED
jgi:hypothetical protein